MLPADASLLESLLWRPEDGYFLLPEHLARMQRGAAHFGVPLDLTATDEALRGCAASLVAAGAAGAWKVRLLVDATGAASTTHEPAKSNLPVRAALAASPVDGDDALLRHKTTARAVYDTALASVRHLAVQDVLLWNERRELTETTSANLVLHLGGVLVTPHVDSGLLAGTFREALLRQGAIREAVVPLADLAQATDIWLVNSVRRWCRVHLVR